MAYRFKLKEDLQEGVRRIAVEQIDKALAAPHAKADRVEWVHETRKSLKRTRALLRLVRDGLGEERWREENAALRQIARKLSALRDRDVMGHTLADLASECGPSLDEAKAWCEASLGLVVKASVSEKAAAQAVKKAMDALEKARERLAKLDVDGELTDVVAKGLARAQRRGRKALMHLEAHATDDNLHELRKCVQTYQRQQSLMQVAWPAVQSVRIDAAKTAAQLLGVAQDLAVLAAIIKKQRTNAGDDEKALADVLIEAARERLAEKRDAALPIVGRLMALRPKAAGEELATCWRIAVAMTAQEGAEADAPGPSRKEDAVAT